MFNGLLPMQIEIYDKFGKELKFTTRGRLYRTSGVDVEYGYVYASGVYLAIPPHDGVELHDRVKVIGDKEYRIVKIDEHYARNELHHLTLQLEEVR